MFWQFIYSVFINNKIKGVIQEHTELSQSLKKKKQKALRIVEDIDIDHVLNTLEKSKKQYELYAYLADERQHIVLLRDIEAMGFSKSSVDTLVMFVAFQIQ